MVVAVFFTGEPLVLAGAGDALLVQLPGDAELARSVFKQGKVEKLNNGEYKAFASYGLYVIVDTTFPFDSYVQSVVESIAEFQARQRAFL